MASGVYDDGGGGGSYRPCRTSNRPTHCATFVYEGVVAHVSGTEIVPGKVRNHVKNVIITRHDEDALFCSQGHCISRV